jgi:hypothetical protein
MSKMGSNCSFGHLKHKLWPNKRPKVKWQFDSRPLKVGNRPDFLACRRHATYRWKALDEGYKFALNYITIEGLHRRLCTFKVTRVPTMRISGVPLGSPGTKSHLDVAPVEKHRVYYKGEGGPGCGESCVSELPVVRPNTKSAPTMH